MGLPIPHGAKQANKDMYRELYHECTLLLSFFIIFYYYFLLLSLLLFKKKIGVTSPFHAKILFELKNTVHY